MTDHRGSTRNQRERLLDGTVTAGTPLALVLAAARAPAGVGELDGLDAAVAAFAAAGMTTGESSSAPRRRRGILAALAAAGFTTQIGLGVAAAAGVAGIVVAVVPAQYDRSPGVPATSSPTSSPASATTRWTSPGSVLPVAPRPSATAASTIVSTGGAHRSAQSARPVRPLQPGHPKHPVSAVHPTHPMRPTHPTHPVHPTHPTHPVRPTHPTHPVKGPKR